MKRFLFTASTLVGLSAWQAAAAPGAGCDTSRRAVAHHSDGSAANPSGAPVPCAVKTGFGGAESRVAVAPNGDVLQTPAIVVLGPGGHPLPGGNLPGVTTPESVFSMNAGIGWSQNRGASWQLIQPDGDLHIEGDNDLYVDRATGRLFYSCLAAPLPDPADDFSLLYVPRACLLSSPASPAGYTSWSRVDMVGWLSENPRFTSAPAPAGQPQPVPGENLGYWCANLVNAPNLYTRTCHRTFDGGASWQFASFIHQNPVHAHSVCAGTSQEIAGYPQGGPDGSLWSILSCGGNNYLIRSSDEASTWQVVEDGGAPLILPFSNPGGPGGPFGGGPELRVDIDGNLYAMETIGTSRLLWTSTDGGLTWSGPFNMTAPAARDAGNRFSAMAIGYQPGQVAATYLVARSGGGFDGYVTVTRNALDPNPVFYSAINAPHLPIVTEFAAFSPPDDFISLDVGPDGTPWAAFMTTCFRDPRGDFVDSYCRQTGAVRTFQGAPWLSAAKVMTMGSLQW